MSTLGFSGSLSSAPDSGESVWVEADALDPVGVLQVFGLPEQTARAGDDVGLL